MNKKCYTSVLLSTHPRPEHSMKSISRPVMTAFFALPAILGLAAVAQVLLIPADPKNTAWLGLSASRLALLAVLLAATVFSLALAVSVWKHPLQALTRIDAILRNRSVLFRACVAALALLLVSYTILAIPDRYLHQYMAVHERLRPVLTWLALVSLQAVLGMLACLATQSAATRPASSTPYRKILGMGAIILAFLLAIWIFIAVTGMGVWPGNAFWGKAGVPVLWPQTLLALLIGIVLKYLLIDKLRLPAHKTWFDIGVCIALWLAACLLWNAQTYEPGVFDTPPHPPAFQIYPSNDAFNYDLVAQSYLVGVVPANNNPDKSIYITFLAFLHQIVGDNYVNFFRLQIAIFALIPVLGYFLGKALHSRQLGSMFGIILVLREQNAIALINVIQVSTAKMILSEPLTTLGVLLFTLVFVSWLRKPDIKNPQLWLAGGILGITGLVRLNALTIVPFAVLAIGIALKLKPRAWLLASALLVGFILISLVPWTYENFRLTGDPLAFVKTKTNGVIVANRYVPVIAGETATPDPASNPAGLVTPTPPGTALPSPGAKPAAGGIGKYILLTENIGQHYLHNLISMTVMLPPTGGLYQLHDMAVLLPFWTIHWDGSLQPDSVLILLMVLCFVALGISTSWSRGAAAGLAPLFVILGYNVSAALALTSGGRYLIPMDWGVLLYFSVGLVEVSGWVAELFGGQAEQAPTPARDAPTHRVPAWAQFTLLTAGLLFIGATPVFLRELPPVLYPAVSPGSFQQLAASLPQLSTPDAQNQIAGLLKDPLIRVGHGRALYPRDYPAKLGDFDVRPALTRPYPFSRLTFYLLGSLNTPVVLPLGNLPDSFDTQADVWVLGCHRQDYLEAVMVILEGKSSTQVLLRSPMTGSCQ